jgi:hypothetical protein
MKKAMFILAIALLLTKVAAADVESFNYSGIPPVNAGNAMGTYANTSEPGWTWSAGWGVINPYTPGSLLTGVPDPSTVPNGGTADAFNWAGANPLTITFSTPQQGVSADVAVLNEDSTAAYVELIAYNGATPVDSSTLALDVVDEPSNFLSLGVIEGTFDITSVAFVGLDSSGNPTGIGDMNQYAIADISTTPEPGTIFMLGSGLLSLAGMLKLRRRSS